AALMTSIRATSSALQWRGHVVDLGRDLIRIPVSHELMPEATGAAEGGADHRRQHDEGSHLRAGRPADQRPHRRRLRKKYRGSPYLSPMIGARACFAPGE